MKSKVKEIKMTEKEIELRLELKALLLPNMGSRFVDPAIDQIIGIIKRELNNKKED